MIVEASSLLPPADRWVKEFSEKREAMAAEVNRILSTRPDLKKLVGADGQAMSEDNNRNFSLFMESLMGHFQAEVLVDTVLWVFRAYRAHDFQTVYWPANLNAWMETLKQSVSPEAFREISPFYAWLIIHIPDFVNITDDIVNKRNPEIERGR
ncbi:MAG: hypothetical protein JXA62_04655 [Candidatus Aminicenantes bacterium]|nr:hypothetical protein [Candidatus Aminicenantes bacterium]